YNPSATSICSMSASQKFLSVKPCILLKTCKNTLRMAFSEDLLRDFDSESMLNNITSEGTLAAKSILAIVIESATLLCCLKNSTSLMPSTRTCEYKRYDKILRK